MISGLLAFFDYDEEIANYCSTNLTPANEWGEHPTEPSIIRLELQNLTYYFAQVTKNGSRTQRERLPKDLFFQLVLLPTYEARRELNKSAYKDLGYDLNS